MTIKRPSFQFYPGDWLNDAGLRLVSVGARGLWIDMLCMMHQGTPYGHLKVNHKVILPHNLARIVGATFAEVEGWLAELAEVSAYSVADDGCFYCRRMIRDEEIRVKRAAGGSYGGNPNLKRRSDHPQEEQNKVNLQSNLPPTPSSSPSSSSSSSPSGNTNNPLTPKTKKRTRPLAVFDREAIPAELLGGGFPESLTAWLEYRQQLGKPVLQSGMAAIYRRAKAVGAAEASRLFDRAMAQGWQGWDFRERGESAGDAMTPMEAAQQWLLEKQGASDDADAN